MIAERFAEIVAARFEEIDKLRATKGRDYQAGSEDTLANFKRHAGELGLTPEQVWGVYASKHWDAILTYLANAADPEYSPSEPVSGRIGDLILYLLLLEGLVEERASGRLVDMQREALTQEMPSLPEAKFEQGDKVRLLSSDVSYMYEVHGREFKLEDRTYYYSLVTVSDHSRVGGGPWPERELMAATGDE